jgi:secondary thiamine-phosphate synthase enzyme
MQVLSVVLGVKTQGPGLLAITREVESWVTQANVTNGLVTAFIRHTSASLVIQENADPDVLRDLQAFFERLAPWGDQLYRHTTEGPDDMPAHVRAALTQTSLSIPVVDGRLALGTWQGIYVWEHRRHGHSREVVLQYIGQ